MHLLGEADPSRDTLIRVLPYLVPEDLATERHEMVCIGPRNVDTIGLQELFGRDQALGGQFVVAEGPKQLAHQDVTLHVFDLDVAHVSRDQLDAVLEVLVEDHVSQSHDCVRVLVQCDHFNIGLSSLCSSEGSPDERATTCSKVEHRDLSILEG